VPLPKKEGLLDVVLMEIACTDVFATTVTPGVFT
jgi:hypothetical protein